MPTPPASPENVISIHEYLFSVCFDQAIHAPAPATTRPVVLHRRRRHRLHMCDSQNGTQGALDSIINFQLNGTSTLGLSIAMSSPYLPLTATWYLN
ncbi:hypothetical protein ACP4OV_027840 [Aristida adscensionis]